MTNYEQLIDEAQKYGLITKEKDLLGYDGLIVGNRIAIRKDLTEKEKACVLAEELGHYHVNIGNILDQRNISNAKQEHLGRMHSYNRMIGLMGIVRAFKAGCKNQYEIAEYLNVTEEFLAEAISAYRSKYGIFVTIDNYAIYFIPNLGIMKIL